MTNPLRPICKSVTKTPQDTLADFEKYAISQGSTHAKRYFNNTFNNIIYKILNIPKADHDRTLWTQERTIHVAIIESVIAASYKESMRESIPYRETYARAKSEATIFFQRLSEIH